MLLRISNRGEDVVKGDSDLPTDVSGLEADFRDKSEGRGLLSKPADPDPKPALFYTITATMGLIMESWPSGRVDAVSSAGVDAWDTV